MICERRAKAQLIDDHVMFSSGPTGFDVASVIGNGTFGSLGSGNTHGDVPSIRSSGWTPASRAAARMKILMLEPVCLGTNAMLISLVRGTNPLPPTMARMAAVLVSRVSIAFS